MLYYITEMSYSTSHINRLLKKKMEQDADSTGTPAKQDLPLSPGQKALQRWTKNSGVSKTHVEDLLATINLQDVSSDYMCECLSNQLHRIESDLKTKLFKVEIAMEMGAKRVRLLKRYNAALKGPDFKPITFPLKTFEKMKECILYMARNAKVENYLVK